MENVRRSASSGPCELSEVIEDFETPAEDWDIRHCNQKLIGARSYSAGYVAGGNEILDEDTPLPVTATATARTPPARPAATS